MFKTIQTVWRWFTWVQVAAVNGDRQHGWQVKTEAQALHLMQTYKPEWTVMYGKRGKLIGARWM